MELIHDRTLRALDELSQRLFWMNKKIDRMKSVLNVAFVMPIFSNLIHHELAHSYPLLADVIGDMQEEFNYDANYLGIEGATEYYDSVQDMMHTLYNWTIETNEKINETIKVAMDEGDYNIYWKLGDFSSTYSKYITNAQLLQDKADAYGDDLMAMDKDSKKWWKL